MVLLTFFAGIGIRKIAPRRISPIDRFPPNITQALTLTMERIRWGKLPG